MKKARQINRKQGAVFLGEFAAALWDTGLPIADDSNQPSVTILRNSYLSGVAQIPAIGITIYSRETLVRLRNAVNLALSEATTPDFDQDVIAEDPISVGLRAVP